MDAISATVASASAPPPPLTDTSNTTLDKDAFLKLLVAQLKYQDPTAPTDVSQMMSQTSQLSMVERLDQIAAGIERLGGSTPISNAASMLGKQVTFDNGFAPVTSVVDAVRLVDGNIILSAGGQEVPLDALLEVRDQSLGVQPGATATPTASSSTADDGHGHDHADAGAPADGGGTYDTPDY